MNPGCQFVSVYICFSAELVVGASTWDVGRVKQFNVKGFSLNVLLCWRLVEA